MVTEKEKDDPCNFDDDDCLYWDRGDCKASSPEVGTKRCFTKVSRKQRELSPRRR